MEVRNCVIEQWHTVNKAATAVIGIISIIIVRTNQLK